MVITGGTGFLGRAIASLAEEEGWGPVLLALETHETSPDGFDVVGTDVTDATALAGTLGELRPDAIVHLAAFGAGDAGLLNSAEGNPELAVKVNVGGFLNVLRGAAACGCRRVSWSSSTTVYGKANRYGGEEVNEDAALWPESVYGTTKVACEFLGPRLSSDLGVQVTAIRPPLIYGPGRWYGGALEELNRFVREAGDRRRATLVANEQLVDWMHVRDAARALLLPLDRAPKRHVYNVLGHRTSMAQMGRLIVEVCGSGEVDVGNGASDPFPLIDGTRAEGELGFHPQYDARRGIVDWLSNERKVTG